MPLELVYFHRGLSYDARSALQKGGFLTTCQNINLETEGTQTLRDAYGKVNTTAIGSIHSAKIYGSNLFVGDGAHLRYNDLTGDFTDLYGSFGTKPWMFEERQRVIILWCNSMQLMERMHSGGSFVIPVRDIICSRLWVIGCLI